MAAFKIIHDSMWDSKEFQELSTENKLLLIYLKTNKHTHFSGLYRLPLLYISSDTKEPISTIETGIKLLQTHNFLLYDYDNSIIWVKEMLREQTKNLNFSKNQLRGIINQVYQLRESDQLFQEFAKHYKEIKFNKK
jgi:hypothetical protein